MSTTEKNSRPWPDISYEAWAESCTALHLWSQIIGKYRLSLTPWVNHSWHATLYVTPQGLTTGPIPDPGGSLSIALDFCEHRCNVVAEGGRLESFALESMSIARFHQQLAAAVGAQGGHFDVHGSPNEVEDPTPFEEDHQARPYDADAVARFHQALLRIEAVFSHFRTGYLGKVSPVHLFWGALDLAVTRFSGRRAPAHPGGIPNLPLEVTREAYSHEVSSAGFWPGAGVGEAMFYSYAYPTPAGFADQAVEPETAYWHADLGEFLLPYAAVRSAEHPEGTLMAFLQSSYAAAARSGGWDREALECDLGRLGKPRLID